MATDSLAPSHHSDIDTSHHHDPLADSNDTLITPLRPTLLRTSVVISTHNSATTIGEMLLRLHRVMEKTGHSYEVVLVDGHSDDGTVNIAQQVARNAHIPLRVVTPSATAGRVSTARAGVAAAKGDVVALIAGSLDYAPEAIPTLIAALRDCDIVVGDRRQSMQAHHKGQLRPQLGHHMTGVDTDVLSGLKVMHLQTYHTIAHLCEQEADFDLAFMVKAAQRGCRIGNVPIAFRRETSETRLFRKVTRGAAFTRHALTLRWQPRQHTTRDWLLRYGLVPLPEAGVTGALRLAVAEAEHDNRRESTYYRAWLTQEAQIHARKNDDQVQYVKRAEQPQRFKGGMVAPFTPLKREQMAMRTFTVPQLIICLGIVVGLAVSIVLFQYGALRMIIAAIILLYLSNLLLLGNIARRSLHSRVEEHIDDDIVHALHDAEWPRYTILCPLFREVAVVPQFVAAMAAMSYPQDRLQILFLTEEIDDETRASLRSMGLPANFQIVTVPRGQPQTKPRACNYGLMQATGDYVVIYDAEDIPDPLQLKKAVLTFANHESNMACVQAKLNYYNSTQNVLTRLFTIEYSIWFDFIMPGLQATRIALPLGGTSNHFRASILRKLGAWDPFNVTEDCDLGLRLVQHQMHTVILDSTTMEEANSDLGNWVRQRSRWIKGYMQTYLVHMRRPFAATRREHLSELLSLQYIISSATVFFVNPLMWAMLVIYLLFRGQVEVLYHLLYPTPVLYTGMICLVFGNFLNLFIAMLACAKRQQYTLIPWAIMLPVYWVMLSVAALLAFTQLIFKPHYWEKTRHGLHLQHKKTP